MGEQKIEPFINQKELAKLLGMSEGNLVKLRRDKGLPYYKVGGAVRYRWSEVEKWAKERRKVND